MISLLISQFAHGIWKPKFAQCAHVGNDVAPEKQDASIKCALVKKHKIVTTQPVPQSYEPRAVSLFIC